MGRACALGFLIGAKPPILNLARPVQPCPYLRDWGVRDVSKQDVISFSAAGLLTWLMASAFYAAFGESLLETAFWFYALNAFMATGAAAMAFQSIIRIRQTPRNARLLPALTFALPGLVAGALALTMGRPLLEEASIQSLIRYAIFLAACYGAVVAHGFETRFERQAVKA